MERLNHLPGNIFNKQELVTSLTVMWINENMFTRKGK
jgi:hypothetical protein